MRTVAIIQARTGSTRLPGKVLELVEGNTVLGHTVERARRVRGIDRVVVATSTAPADDAVVRDADRLGVPWFRGSEDDVLSRYLGAARQAEADVVVRITSDCPLLDPEISARVVRALHDGLDRFDYASSSLERTYPRGLDTEAFTRAALEHTAERARAPREREHVTLYMYEHPEAFRLLSVRGERSHAEHRWTVDVPEDLALVREIYARLTPSHGPIFGMDAVLELCAREPALTRINQHVEQRRP